ncbi:MAG: hypothetical protein IJ591_08545 [Lachnospiraceae bacterium]|nr:hypothetical protein [Lachnospiraceae bacterium]
MSGNDIFNAISNIDPKYIDEAAYELHSQEDTEDSVSGSSITDISTKRKIVRARRLIWVALPSVAAVLLILGVAIPAILRTGSTQPAATAEAASEAPADNAEATAEAEAVDEAAPAAEEVEQAVPEAAAEEPVADEAPEMSDETLTAGADSKSESNKDRQTYTTDVTEETAAAEEEAVPSPVAVYENGLLTIDTAELFHGPLDEAEYAIFDISEEQSAEPVAKGKLEDVTKQKELTDEPLVLDLTSLALKPGEYRIEMETGTAEFTVSR